MLISEALKEVVDTLTTAGVPASTEPNELTLPGAFVVPGTISFEYLSGEDFDMQIDIYLLTPNNGSLEVIDELQGMLLKVRSVYGVLNAEPMALPLSNNAEPIPGLLITLLATITKD